MASLPCVYYKLCALPSTQSSQSKCFARLLNAQVFISRSLQIAILYELNFFRQFPFSLLFCIEFVNKLALETIHWQNGALISHLNHDVTWNLLTTLFASNGCSLFIFGCSQFHIIRRPIQKLFNRVEVPPEGREHKTFIFYCTSNISVLFVWIVLSTILFFYYYRSKFIIFIDSNNW